jgi:outer membrane protein
MMMFLLWLYFQHALAAVPDGLKQIHQLAVEQSELLKIAEAREEQARERKTQARGSLMPQLVGRYQFTEVDPLPGPPSPFRRINQYSALINVSQPLYRGDAFSAYSFTKLDIELQKRLKEQEGLALWMDVADVYYNLWRAKIDAENVRNLRLFSDERVKELRERVRVGRSRRGELMQAQAQLAAVDAELSQAENLVKDFQQRIHFLTGKELDPIFGALPESSLPKLSLNHYLDKMMSRPDIQARSQEILMAEKRVKMAQAGHEPTLDFSANRFFLRTGILEESRWDLGVVLNVPIFQGGTVLAASREASERKREVILQFERLKREVLRDIRILWQNAQTVEKVMSDLKRATDQARQTYEENKKDYRYGLVTSLDVLVSLNEYIATKRRYESSVVDRELIHLQLQLASGDTP